MSTFNNFAPGIMLANHFSIALKPFVFATENDAIVWAENYLIESRLNARPTAVKIDAQVYLPLTKRTFA